MQQKLKAIAEDSRFQHSITGVIIFAGILVGLETYPSLLSRFGSIMHVLDKIVLWIFVAEVLVKIGAEGRKPWRYFFDPWNIFDFVIVAACFLPFAGSAATVLRLLRLLRVLKLVRALPKLQLLVGALLKSIPSMAYVSLLLLLLFYVYGVAAVFMWGENDPVHFGRLETALVSLFRTVTLEDWTDLMYTQMLGCKNYGYDSMAHLCINSKAQPLASVFYFVSFVLFGTMIILNLFIGVIMNGMDEAQREADEEFRRREQLKHGNIPTIQMELASVHRELEALQEHLGRIQKRAAKEF